MKIYAVIMGIIVIGVFAFDLLIRYLERLLIPWKDRIYAKVPACSRAADNLRTK